MWHGRLEVPRDGRPAEYRCGKNGRPFSAAFLVLRCKVWLTPTARAPCSNDANIGECKTWMQSELCSWQNSLRGQHPPKCIYSVPAQETAKHSAKFGWPLVSNVGAAMTPKSESCLNLLGCFKLTNGSQLLVG